MKVIPSFDATGTFYFSSILARAIPFSDGSFRDFGPILTD